MNQQNKRIFISLNIPKAISCLKKIKTSSIAKEMRFVSEKNLHLTLFFLGDLSIMQVLWLQSELKSIHFTAFELIGIEIGFFSQKSIATVVWLGFQESSALTQLHQQIQELLRKMQTSTQIKNIADHPFVPHCTLGRSKSLPKTLAIAELQKIKCEQIYQSIGSFHLMESRLNSHGAHYLILEQYPANIEKKIK